MLFHAMLAFVALTQPAVSERVVEWEHAGARLTGTLHLPSTPGRHAVAIIVPGSGCMPLSHRFYAAHIAALTARGIGVFAYDKRGCGKSTGNWQDVDLDGLAADVIAVLPRLAADSGVDPARIGAWGLSQGGWVSLIAATKSPMVRHVVLLSGPPMTVAEQGHAVVELGMRAKGVDEAGIADAVALDRLLANVYRTGTGWEAAEAAIAAAKAKPWFAASGIELIPREAPYWKWLGAILDHDPLPALRALTIPVLAVYGERDLLVPAARSKGIIESLAPTARGPREVVIIAGAGHQLRAGGNADWTSEYWASLERWARGQKIIP